MMEHVETLESLKDSVVKLLVAEYEFTIDDAEEAVETSVEKHEPMWNENAEAKDLAKFLASDESDV